MKDKKKIPVFLIILGLLFFGCSDVTDSNDNGVIKGGETGGETGRYWPKLVKPVLKLAPPPIQKTDMEL